jgi:hypothetical protein
LIYDFSYRIGGQNACFAIGNGTVQNFAENKGEITGISFQKVDDHEGIAQAIFGKHFVHQSCKKNHRSIAIGQVA